MNTMEFEEIQKIWDVQNNEPVWAINEQALHNRVLAKKKQGYHITNISELLLIIINLGAAIFIFWMNFFKPHANIFMYIMAGWMFITALYVLVSRIRRIKGDNQFDRSLQSDLHHALAVATYQVRLSQIMRWNILPIGVFSLLGIWEGGKLYWIAGLIMIVFAVSWYASRWEHNIYKSRKRGLEILQQKLEGEG